MATEQYRDIGGLLPGHGELVHHLQAYQLLAHAGDEVPRQRQPQAFNCGHTT